MTGNAVQVERHTIAILLHPVRVELALRAVNTLEPPLVLFTLRWVRAARRVRIRLQVGRVPALRLKHVNFTVVRPPTLSACHPETRPRRAPSGELDTRLGVKIALRRVLDVPVVVFRLNHRRRERGSVFDLLTVFRARACAVHGFHTPSVLVPLLLCGGVAGDQVQVTAGHVHVLRAVRVIDLRFRFRVETRVLVSPLGGVHRRAVELVLETYLVVSLRAHRFRRRLNRVSRPRGGRATRANNTARDCRRRSERKQGASKPVTTCALTGRTLTICYHI